MTAAPVSAKELARWRTDGFLVARGMWEREEIAECTERFAEITAAGTPIPDHWDPEPDSSDPLLRCPRIMHLTFAAPQSKAGSRGACASNMSSHTCQIWSRVRVAAVCGSSMAAW